MRGFDSKYGYDGSGALEELIGKIQEIKSSPEAGKKRVVIKPKGMDKSHAVVDVAMKHAKDLETKQTYKFMVKEKDSSRNPGHQRQKSVGFKAYSSDDAAEVWTSATETHSKMNRFGGGSSTGKASRTKF